MQTTKIIRDLLRTDDKIEIKMASGEILKGRIYELGEDWFILGQNTNMYRAIDKIEAVTKQLNSELVLI